MDKNDLCPHVDDFVSRAGKQRLMRLEINQIGSEMVSDRWHNIVLSSGFWRAYVTDRPGVELTHDNTRMAYHPDHIMVIPAWVPFYFHHHPDVGHGYIHFTPLDLPKQTLEGLFRQPFLIKDLKLRRDLAQFAQKVAHNPQHPLLGLEAQSLAHQILMRSIQDFLTSDQQLALVTAQQQRQRLDPALGFIDRHIAQTIAVSDLADLLNVGPAHCIRLFKRLTGQTPTQYILDRRIDNAAERIFHSDDSLDHIAQACGLGDRRYMARVFKQRRRQSPSAYRNRSS